MPVEETMWNIPIARDVESYDLERLRAALSAAISRRLAPGKRLLRVVTWSPNGGGLFRPKPGFRQYAVAYEVALSV